MNRGYTLLWRKIWSNSLLCEPSRKFSRLEAWLFITNVLAAGMDDAAAGQKRGEFIAGIRFFAKTFNWNSAKAQRFIDQLIENSMISRVIRESIHPAIQEAGHIIICNYETYNQPRRSHLSAPPMNVNTNASIAGTAAGIGLICLEVPGCGNASVSLKGCVPVIWH